MLNGEEREREMDRVADFLFLNFERARFLNPETFYVLLLYPIITFSLLHLSSFPSDQKGTYMPLSIYGGRVTVPLMVFKVKDEKSGSRKE